MGVALVLSSFSKRLIKVQPIGWHVKKLSQRYIYNFMILGIMLILFGSVLFCLSYTAYNPAPSTVTIYEGHIVATSEYFFDKQPFGSSVSTNKKAGSYEIATAFVGEIGSGNLKLQKQAGLDYGNVHVGRFTLRNGATAYVTTTNSTCLIIQLDYGDYIIVGTQDTQSLANSFAQNVHPLLLTPKQ